MKAPNIHETSHPDSRWDEEVLALPPDPGLCPPICFSHQALPGHLRELFFFFLEKEGGLPSSWGSFFHSRGWAGCQSLDHSYPAPVRPHSQPTCAFSGQLDLLVNPTSQLSSQLPPHPPRPVHSG